MLCLTVYSLAWQLAMFQAVATLSAWVLKREKLTQNVHIMSARSNLCGFKAGWFLELLVIAA